MQKCLLSWWLLAAGCWMIPLQATRASGAASAELILQTGPQKEVDAVAYSPDGRILASAGESEFIRLWDRATGDLLRTLPGHPERVFGLAFSPDGQYLASSGTDGSVKLWDYRAAKLMDLFTNHVGNWSRRVAFSKDSRWLAAASYDGTVSVWETAGGKVFRTLPTVAPIADLRFTPDGKSLITAARTNQPPQLQLWNLESGKVVWSINAGYSVNGIALSGDGRLLATCGSGGTADIWEVASQKRLQTIRVHDEDKEIFDIDVSADGRWIATAGQWVDRVWSASSGELLCEMRGHDDGTFRIQFSPDGKEIATGSSDSTARLWDARSGKIKRIIRARPADKPVTSIAFSRDGGLEAIGSVDGIVRVWDGINGGFRYDLRGHEGPVYALAFNADGSVLFSGSADRTVRAWDTAHGTITAIHPYFDRVDTIGAIAFGGSNGLLATASGPWSSAGLDPQITFWKTYHDRPVGFLRGHTTGIRALAYLPHQDLIASASGDGTIKLWDSRRMECLVTLTNLRSAESLAFSPDEHWLAAGMADGSVQVFGTNGLALSRSWRAHQRPVQSLAFSSDGRWLATASADKTIGVWEWPDGREARRFTNVTSQYLPLAFHPKQPVLAFAQSDDLVVHINVETGETIFQRAIFPDEEWLAWNPAKPFYIASSNGEAHARLRFASQLRPVYPLTLYRHELNRPANFFQAIGSSAPVLAPKNFQRWWYWYPYKKVWLYGGLTVLVGWVAIRLRRGWIAERRRHLQENVSRQLIVSQEAERKRIASELHDSLGQNLLIIKNRLYLAQHRPEGTDPAEQLQEISQTVSQTIEEVREISHNLRPYQLDRLGLTKAVKSVVNKIAASGTLAIEMELANIDGALPPENEINFYRIVQECLNNILKHSDAATARIAISRTPGKITMVVEDDGRGFDYRLMMSDPEHPRGFGLTGLNERVRILGATFACHSEPGKGARLVFEIPAAGKNEKRN